MLYSTWKNSLDFYRYCPNCYSGNGYTMGEPSYCNDCGWEGTIDDNITHDVAFKKMRKEKLKNLNDSNL